MILVEQIQVQVRVPSKTVSFLDKKIKEGVFSSRSDAIKTMIYEYQEKEKTRKFFEMLVTRKREIEKEPEKLIALSEI